MRHSLRIHLPQCKNMYRKWEGNRDMPVARCRDDELHSDTTVRKQETESRAIPTAGDYNVDFEARGWAASPEFEMPRQQCTSCSRSFSIDVITR
jgi:hypothetical protein